ncbi:MAG: UmuC protein [Pyramidobacter sp.]|nr:UmuC protein [Pyramidobacter sp.]
MSRLLGLADCNNFFVSCERLFRPDLLRRPVVVLSNNDGCVISRSNEAKALGIPMGAPFFQYKAFCEKYGVAVFSGNMQLYRDMSSRVARHLSRWTDALEQYSIDECFFNLSIAEIDDPEDYCRKIRAAVLRCTGIPVSIGVAPTKTLCKLGSEVAKARGKKDPDDDGVCMLLPLDAARLFATLPPDEIWGLGGQTVNKLASKGVTTVAQFLARDEKWIRATLGLRALQAARELRGFSCFPLEEHEEKQKSMMVSASFGTKLTEYDDIKAAVVRHAVEGAFRLRRAGLRAGVCGCRLRTSYFAPDPKIGARTAVMTPPTAQDHEIIAAALACLKKIFVPGVAYAKTGVFFEDLHDSDTGQLRFEDLDPARQKMDRLFLALDELNVRFGRRTVIPAAIKDTSKSDPHREHLSRADPFLTVSHNAIRAPSPLGGSAKR